MRRALLGLAAAWAFAAAAQAATVNRIIAVVNDDVITDAELAQQLREVIEDRGRQPTDEERRQLQRALLGQLVERKLMLQEAKRLEVPIGANHVTDRLNTIRQRYASEEEFRQSLATSGVTEEQLKEDVRKQLMVQWVIEAKVRSHIVVSPQEVSQEIDSNPELAKPGDRVRASHLLIRVDEDRTEAEAKALIEQLHQQLARGASFEELARRHSGDQYAEEGGAMDWVAQGELMPGLDAALFSLAPGGLSAPIRSELGYHLLRVDERRASDRLSVLDANRAVHQRLFERKFNRAFREWLDDLKRRAYIEVELDTSHEGG